MYKSVIIENLLSVSIIQLYIHKHTLILPKSHKLTHWMILYRWNVIFFGHLEPCRPRHNVFVLLHCLVRWYCAAQVYLAETNYHTHPNNTVPVFVGERSDSYELQFSALVYDIIHDRHYDFVVHVYQILSENLYESKNEWINCHIPF